MSDRFEVASRANVPPFHVMDLLAAAATRQRTHGDLVNLLAGQPSTGAPAPVREEAKRLLDSGDPLGYTPATGILELREAIAGHHRRTHGIDVHPDEVVVTTGSSGGFLLAFLAAFEVGDRVAMARPGYPCYRNVLAALGLRGRRDPDRTGDPLPAHRRAGGRARGHQGAGGRQPRQPDRHDAAARASSRRSRRTARSRGSS